ncbi:hypothetical protein FV139_01360 [Parahaliea maris]|uniref:Uncharacterized protein n=1 Tax=Parahaliea maris TaxID=2716870 RepID=A0A5C9A818_9GAMM|nr:cysteine rich repeat-containing protein [Parahaliea maris]TXS96182.1 hypothetical protein FV139_01360 [Parahaliea maris]
MSAREEIDPSARYGSELQTHCSDIEMGGGQVMACLEAHEAELGEGCKSAIAQTTAE